MSRPASGEAIPVPRSPHAVERELSALVASAATPSALFDTSMRYIAASDRWIVENGLRGRPLLGRSLYEGFPTVPERWKHVHRRALAGETVTSELDPVERAVGETGETGKTGDTQPAGAWRWCAQPWRNEDGAIGGIVIAMSDVSEIRRLHVEVEEAARESDLLLENAGAAIVVTDGSGRVLRASETLAALCGLEGANFVGLGIDELFADEMPQASDRSVGFTHGFAGLRDGSCARAEGRAWLERAGTTPRSVRCTAVRLGAGSDGTARFVVLVRDETERVALERRMQEADRLSSLSMLGAGLAHELGNVLLPMQAHLNALKAAAARGATLDGSDAHVAAIGGGIAYLRELADGAHRRSPRDEKTGRAEPPRALVGPAEWWPSVDRLLRCALPSGARLDVDAPASCPAPRVHSNVLMQCLLNLLVNARDAIVDRHGADGRGGEVRVAFAGVGRGSRARVRVSVCDNGAGMDEATLARAREAFFTTKPNGRGTGLGLAMVSAMVEDCGGQLLVRSMVNAGTEVVLTLPAAFSALA